MPRNAPIQTNFTAGELSELLSGRVDVTKYFNGCSILENFYPLQYGGATRRPGSVFVAEVKDSSKSTRLIDFEFSTTDTYVIEVGDQYMRFFRNGGAVLESDKTITNISQADPGVVTSTAHGFNDGDEVVITGVVGMTEVNNKRYIVANKTANDFELTDKDGNDVDTTGYTAYSSGGTVNRVYEISTPYLEADIFDIDFRQSADKVYLAHEEYAPRELTRTGHTSWTLTAFDFEGGPLRPTNTDTSHTMTPGTDTGTGVTLTSSASFFTANMVGGVIRVKDGWADIVGYTSGTVVTIDIVVDLNTGPGATDDWAIGAWNDEYGYPGSVAFMEQRLYWGGSPTDPQNEWGSETSIFTNHFPGATDTDPINIQILNTRVNAIDWMMGGVKGLAGGTRAGVSLTDGGGIGDAVTPSNVRVRRSTTYGCKKIRPAVIGDFIYYIGRDGRTMREFAYNFDIDAHRALDMTVLSEHILKSGVVDMAYQQSPNNLLWCVRDDGVLVSLTREIDQEVIGWSRHIVAGTFEAGDAEVESVTVIPNGDYDQVWIIVKRTINGVTRRYVEYLADPILDNEDGEVPDSAIFADSALCYNNPVTISGATKASPVVVTATAHGFSDGDLVKIVDVKGMTQLNGNTYKVANKAANTFELTDPDDDSDIDGTGFSTYVANGEVRKKVTSLSGLEHLEGETVNILGDGAEQPTEVVTNGAITADTAAAIFCVGLKRKARGRTMRLEGGSATGTAQGKHKRIYEAFVRLYKTVGLSIGYSESSNLETVVQRTADMDMDEAIPLFTGDKQVTFPASNDERDGYIYFEQDNILPCTLVALMPKVEVHDT